MGPRKKQKQAVRKPAEKLGRAERTRARLIEAAVDEFAEKGFHEATISGIVARVRVTQPTFYIYFESKEAIHNYLVERVRREISAVIRGARVPLELPTTDVAEKLRGAIEAFLQYFVENPKLASIGYFDVEHNAGIREDIVALVSRNLSFEQGAGYCRPDLDPLFFSQCYNGSLERLIRVYLFTGQYSARSLAEKLVDLYCYGSIPESVRSHRPRNSSS